MPPYQPQPLTQRPPGRFTQLIEAAKKERLVLYLGAGISMAEPSCGPTGREVAAALRPIVAQILGAKEEELENSSLEELAQQVADHEEEALAGLKVRASEAADFRGITPNFGHEAAALLLREGAVKLISVNWDCGIEIAGQEIQAGIKGVATAQESIEIAQGLVVLKVHGCATRPPTLAITQGEVDEPQGWAVGRVQGALAGGIVAFVGLGTVGLYVREPLEELVAAWGENASSVVVADPALSEPWEVALGGPTVAARAHIECTADAFLDDLLRGMVLDGVVMSEQQIRSMPQDEEWVVTMLKGFEKLRDALCETDAVAVIRWWRDGVSRAVNGAPFITAQNGKWSLMTAAFLVGEDGGPVEVLGSRGRQTVATSERYLEIVSRPDQPISDVERIGRFRIQRRFAEGVYPTAKPVSVVVAGSIGRFPSEEVPADISAGSVEMTDIAEGIEAIPIHFVAAENGVQGRLAS